MKLQHLAIIFVIIIVPISMVMASYIQNQIDAITLQSGYDSNLINATYSAMKAFQINTTNNKYSSISDSKIRDIEASIATFYNSLNTSMSDYSAYAQDLEGYIPAILFTLYDGYYIYSSYDNVYSTTGTEEDEKVQINIEGRNYQNGLRPYVYYSAKYQLNNGNIIVVNYTLDNAITVYGDFGNGYETRSGYLINPDYVQNINDNAKTLVYDGVTIEPEILTEHLITIENQQEGITKEGDYQYIFYQNEKVYQDKDDNGNPLYYDANGNATTNSSITGIPVIFWYQNYMKTYVNDARIREYARSCNMRSTSAFDYYNEAKVFSEWVIENLGDIEQKDTLMIEDGITPIGDSTTYLAENTGDAKIFDVGENNDPMLPESTFNNHRLAIIRKSIETNLNTVISNYHTTTLYDYAMPIMSEEDWYKILNNVTMVTFMQGMTIGYRYYNNYAVVTNNVNKEVVKAENIYIVAEDANGNREYHQPGCKALLEGLENDTITLDGAYPTASFQRQSIRMSDNSEDDLNFYLQARGRGQVGENITGRKYMTGCYYCIVNATADYDTNDILEGIDLIDYYNKIENGGTGTISYRSTNSAYGEVRKAYLTALARERQDLYKSNFDLSD